MRWFISSILPFQCAQINVFNNVRNCWRAHVNNSRSNETNKWCSAPGEKINTQRKRKEGRLKGNRFSAIANCWFPSTNRGEKIIRIRLIWRGIEKKVKQFVNQIIFSDRTEKIEWKNPACKYTPHFYIVPRFNIPIHQCRVCFPLCVPSSYAGIVCHSGKTAWLTRPPGRPFPWSA